MSCEECKEQVFELLEREAIDPEGVRAILAKCPDCRQEFDELKAALALARELPLEPPPPELDARILAAAERRTAAPSPSADGGEAVPLRKRLLQPPPWAMAAIALLAVGVGVWSIPRSVEFESEIDSGATPEAAAPSAPAVDAEAPEEQRAARVIAQKSAEPVVEPVLRKERAASKRRRPKTAKREARRADSEDSLVAEVEVVQETKTSRPTPSASRGIATEAAAGAAARDLAAADAPLQEEADERSNRRAACEANVSRLEERLETDRAYEPSPEEELAVGRCYALLGHVKNARVWLERAAEHAETKDRALESLARLPKR